MNIRSCRLFSVLSRFSPSSHFGSSVCLLLSFSFSEFRNLFLIFFNLPLELPHDRVTSKHLKIYSSSLKRPRLYQLKPERRYSPLRNLSGFRFSFVGLSCLLCLLLRSLKREKYMAAAASRPVVCLYRESSYIGTDFGFITRVPNVPVSVFLCCQSKRSATRGFFGVSFFSMSSHKD